MTQLEERLRHRWMRWLGQKTRSDKPYWTTLLDCNWTGWASSILARKGDFSQPKMIRISVKLYFIEAIKNATIEDFSRLDGLYIQDKWKRK